MFSHSTVELFNTKISDFSNKPFTIFANIYRTVSKSRQNIPAAAGSAEEATTSTVHMNGGGAMNGVSGESDTEDMDVN